MMIEDVYLVFTYWRVIFNFNFSLCYLPGQFRKLVGGGGGGGELTALVSSSFVRHNFYSNSTYFKYNYDVHYLRI